MKQEWILLTCLLTFMVHHIYSDEIDYSCNPAGFITVLNPNATRYIGAFAETFDKTQNCTVQVFQANSTITIDNCLIDKNISLYLMTTSNLLDLLTADYAYHILRCKQLPSTGVYRIVSDDSWVTNIISTSMEPVVTPKIILHTQIKDIESKVERESAIVGEPLLWDIDGPVGYIVLPVNCTAESGAGSEPVQIVENGCSLDTYLLSHFDYVSNTSKHILEADLYAFRFANSEEVVIECQMKGCHNHSTACDFTCPENRKRDTNEQHMNEPEQISKRVSDSDQKPDIIDRDDDDDNYGEFNADISVFLRVYYSGDFSLGKGSRDVPSFILVTAIGVSLQIF